MTERQTESSPVPSVHTIIYKTAWLTITAAILVMLYNDPFEPAWLNMMAVMAWVMLGGTELVQLVTVVQKRRAARAEKAVKEAEAQADEPGTDW